MMWFGFFGVIFAAAAWLAYEVARAYSRAVSHIHPPPPARSRRRHF
jgi:hypothetical protein